MYEFARNSPNLKRTVALLVILIIGAVMSACGSGVEPEVSYKPPLLPAALVVDKDGVSIEGDTSIVTAIGVFSVGAKYELAERKTGTMYVIVRDRKRGTTGFDSIYELKIGDDQFSAVVNGETLIEVKDGRVLIDVTDGSIDRIEFKRVESTITEADANAVTKWRDAQAAKWNRGYRSSFYQPFALSKWAYDDSTIGKWCGIGFVWFLLRLALALVLLLVDLVLSFVFLIAQVAYMLSGGTGRNIVWGLAVLFVVIVGGFALANQ